MAVLQHIKQVNIEKNDVFLHLFKGDLSTLIPKNMKQSLPNIIKIGTVPCEVLSPNIMEKHLAQVPVGVFQTPTAIEHYGNATCEAEQEYDNSNYLEKTSLQFSTTDELKQYPPMAFVITDAQNKSWIIGTKEPPYPIVEISKSIEKDSNIFAVKVTFTRKKSLIPCSV